MLHIVVDINGVLISRVWSKSGKPYNDNDNVIPMETKNGYMHVFLRPGAIELLNAIHSSGHAVVFWSSMTTEYMMPIVDLIVGKTALNNKYIRILSQVDCVAVRHPDPKITYKPLFLKDVERIYERYPNTDGVVFIDDEPLKMRCNGDSEVIIVKPWKNYKDTDDKELFNLIPNLPTHFKNALS